MDTSLTASDLLNVMEYARYELVESIIWDDSGYPYSGAVEAMARLTEALRQAGRELPTDIGRRVIMEGDGAEGVITHQYLDHSPVSYVIYVDGEELYTIYDNTDQPITRDDFTFVEDAE